MIETLVTHSIDKKTMAKVTKWLGQALSDTAFDGQAYAVKTLIAHGHVDSGFLIDNINVDLTRIPKGETRVYTQVPYAAVHEFGAGPSGEQPTAGWWAPEAPIKAWVARKLGKTGKDLDNTTYAIRAAIYKRGLIPAPFMRPAADHMRKQLAIYAQQAIGRAFKEEMGPLTVVSKEAH